MVIEHINYVRIGSCSRCGQCCGADSLGCWSESWPEDFFGYTQDQLDTIFPVPALLGVPRPNHLSGQIEIDGYIIKYYWYKGLRKSKDNAECPFLVYESDTGFYACVLARTRYDFWVRNCEFYPGPTMGYFEKEQYIKEHPKCSYEWIPEDQIKTIAKTEE